MNLKPNEQPPEDNRLATREEIEEASRLADLIPSSSLPFNENGEKT